MRIEYVSIYFVLGEAPQGWTRNAIKDPPSNGWANAFIIRKEGFQTKVFIPYTLQSWPVPEGCYELERYKPPIKELNKEWMLDCLTRNLRTYSKISGAHTDVEAGIEIIKWMGFEVPEEFVPKEEMKPERKAKEPKPKSAVREAREGLISASQIADELGILPRVLRGYLRAAKIEKPEVGWAGDAAWADMIREVLKTEMSKEKPVKEKKAPPPPEPVKPKSVKLKLTKKQEKELDAVAKREKPKKTAVKKKAAPKTPAKKKGKAK